MKYSKLYNAICTNSSNESIDFEVCCSLEACQTKYTRRVFWFVAVAMPFKLHSFVMHQNQVLKRDKDRRFVEIFFNQYLTCYWALAMCISSRPELFFGKDVLNNWAKLTGKHLRRRRFLNRVVGWSPAT